MYAKPALFSASPGSVRGEKLLSYATRSGRTTCSTSRSSRLNCCRMAAGKSQPMTLAQARTADDGDFRALAAAPGSKVAVLDSCCDSAVGLIASVTLAKCISTSELCFVEKRPRVSRRWLLWFISVNAPIGRCVSHSMTSGVPWPTMLRCCCSSGVQLRCAHRWCVRIMLQ